MTSILSFDSRSMSYLLDAGFSEHFSSDYPLFYRNKYQKGKGKDVKYFYRSAIDSALKNNQVRAVELIIRYIEDYQNRFESGYLFYRNFPSLLDKGIDIQPLLRSEVFNFQFDFDEWPSTHHNPDEYLRPFNESIFMIRKHYRTVFPEEDFAPIDDDDKSEAKKIDSSKIYKIRYSVNFLPILGAYVDKQTDPYTKEVTRKVNNADVNILGLFCECGQLDWFVEENLQDLIKFKWDGFGFSLHFFGCCIHILYILLLFMYNNIVYIDQLPRQEDLAAAKTGGTAAGSHKSYSTAILGGIIYPLGYEIVQMFN